MVDDTLPMAAALEFPNSQCGADNENFFKYVRMLCLCHYLQLTKQLYLQFPKLKMKDRRRSRDLALSPPC
jgi:hypothetical protein